MAAAAEGKSELAVDVLFTQVARALGLQGRYEEAVAILDDLENADELELSAREKLERGRVLNSSGSPADARPLFEAAFDAASEAGFEHLAIDALHMVTIVAGPEEQRSLHQQALSLASAASDPRARDWRASVLNNLGWSYFDLGEHEKALVVFEEAVGERQRMGKAREIGVARWSVGRTLRALGRTDQALAKLLDLVQWMAAAELTDSFVEEEIGECMIALGRPDEASGHFEAAASLLAAGGPGESPDPDSLARLRELQKDYAAPG